MNVFANALIFFVRIRFKGTGRRNLIREKTKRVEKMKAFLRPDARFSEKILALFERASRRLRENEVFL